MTEQRIVVHPGEQIADYARKAKLDLLVMGPHGRGALKAALPGSVASRLAAKCTTPLPLIRQAQPAPRAAG